MKKTALTFKKLVEKISNIMTEKDRAEAFSEIDFSYQWEKITWNDHETLYRLASIIETR